MNTTGFEKERGISLGGGELDLETEVKITQDGWPNGYDYNRSEDAAVSSKCKVLRKEKMSTSIRVAAKITLGWNIVYDFDFWVMEHSAGSEVVLGTDFMIPAGIRLDLFHATAKLPDEVMIPLVKTQNFDDDIPEGMHVPGGPNDNLQIAAGNGQTSGFSETNHRWELMMCGFVELQL
ncbi:Eukaryotic/viral aspartic protease [Phytophthora megakarya]|uniref:Eukaryotic/viral aspartic protease n=1 Tax=Phytophthora megakarya TaxID=4795 RepID=A0A225VPY0_9STRA|nr:Eukaryotic/viral aspartic protease [Phytophthora megakarya]